MRRCLYFCALLIALAAPQGALAASVHLCCDTPNICAVRLYIDYDTRIVIEANDVGGRFVRRAQFLSNAITWQFQGGQNNRFTYYVALDRFSLKLTGRRNDGVSWWEFQCRAAPPPRKQI